MALLSEALIEKEYDTRLVTRNVTKGQIGQEDVEKHVKKLVDESNHGDYMNLETLYESVTGKSGLR